MIPHAAVQGLSPGGNPALHTICTKQILVKKLKEVVFDGD
jgi:hypothetical protein